MHRRRALSATGARDGDVAARGVTERVTVAAIHTPVEMDLFSLPLLMAESRADR